MTLASENPRNARRVTYPTVGGSGIAPTLLRLPNLAPAQKEDAETAKADQSVSPAAAGIPPNESVGFAESVASAESPDAGQTLRSPAPPPAVPVVIQRLDPPAPGPAPAHRTAAKPLGGNPHGNVAESKTLVSPESGESSPYEFLASRRSLLVVLALIAGFAIFGPQSGTDEENGVVDGPVEAATAVKPPADSTPVIASNPMPTLREIAEASKAVLAPVTKAKNAIALPDYAAKPQQTLTPPEPIAQAPVIVQPILPTPPSANVSGGDARPVPPVSVVTQPRDVPEATNQEVSKPLLSKPTPPVKPEPVLSNTPHPIRDWTRYLSPAGIDPRQTKPSASLSSAATVPLSQTIEPAYPSTGAPREPDFRFGIPSGLADEGSFDAATLPGQPAQRQPEARVASPNTDPSTFR